MSLNSWVTDDGAEIGRAQGVQAVAAGVPAEAVMNPILLKPTTDRGSQVVVLGRPWAQLGATEYHARKPELLPIVLDALADLRRRFDVVLCEGAGSPAEVNLLDHDLVNLRLAQAAGLPAIVVGDIDRGGVLAALFGTVALLPDDLRPIVQGFVINKFRGDPALLAPGLTTLAARAGVPTLGVLPWMEGMAIDAEDSLGLEGVASDADEDWPGDTLDVAIVRLPRVSNVTDVDAIGLERGVRVRLVDHAAALGDPDLVVVPGSKATVSDLAWLRRRGFAAAVVACAARPEGPVVLGVCGGHQMLGRTIVDTVESGAGEVDGLGLLPVITRFEAAKRTRRRAGRALGMAVSGYEIHHGMARLQPGAHEAHAWVELDDRWGSEAEGAADEAAGVYGTSLHGLFEEDAFRWAFLDLVARRRGRRFAPTAGASFGDARERRIDAMADALHAHVDLDAVERLIASAAPAPAGEAVGA